MKEAKEATIMLVLVVGTCSLIVGGLKALDYLGEDHPVTAWVIGGVSLLIFFWLIIYAALKGNAL